MPDDKLTELIALIFTNRRCQYGRWWPHEQDRIAELTKELLDKS